MHRAIQFFVGVLTVGLSTFTKDVLTSSLLRSLASSYVQLALVRMAHSSPLPERYEHHGRCSVIACDSP